MYRHSIFLNEGTGQGTVFDVTTQVGFKTLHLPT